MKTNGTKTETTTEKELTTSININFNDVIEFMCKNVVLDKHTYAELVEYKQLVNTKYEQLKLEFDNKLAVKERAYDNLQQSFDNVCHQRDDLQQSIFTLNNKIADLEKQIKKLKESKSKWWKL